MAVPYFKQQEFIDYLKEQGCEVVNSDYWNEFDRVILTKGDISFPLQMQEKYFSPIVVKTCLDLDIKPPPDHLKCWKQWKG